MATSKRNRRGGQLVLLIRMGLLLFVGVLFILSGLAVLSLVLFGLGEAEPLHSEVRWEMLMTIIFLGMVSTAAGICALVHVARGWSQRRAVRVLRALHPDEPWLWRRDWNMGQIRRASKSRMIGPIVFAFGWNTFFLLLLAASGEEYFAKGLSPFFVAVPLLALGGISVGVKAVRAWRDWCVWGDAVFRMETIPGLIGGVLAGTVWSARTRQPARMRLVLSCRRYKYPRDRYGKILWKDSYVLRPEMVQSGPAGTAIPVLFHIPYGCAPESDVEANSDRGRICWRLDLKGGGFGRGANVQASFEVPVFTTAASDSNDQPAPDPAAFNLRRSRRVRASNARPETVE